MREIETSTKRRHPKPITRPSHPAELHHSSFPWCPSLKRIEAPAVSTLAARIERAFTHGAIDRHSGASSTQEPPRRTVRSIGRRPGEFGCRIFCESKISAPGLTGQFKTRCQESSRRIDRNAQEDLNHESPARTRGKLHLRRKMT